MAAMMIAGRPVPAALPIGPPHNPSMHRTKSVPASMLPQAPAGYQVSPQATCRQATWVYSQPKPVPMGNSVQLPLTTDRRSTWQATSGSVAAPWASYGGPPGATAWSYGASPATSVSTYAASPSAYQASPARSASPNVYSPSPPASSSLYAPSPAAYGGTPVRAASPTVFAAAMSPMSPSLSSRTPLEGRLRAQTARMAQTGGYSSPPDFRDFVQSLGRFGGAVQPATPLVAPRALAAQSVQSVQFSIPSEPFPYETPGLSAKTDRVRRTLQFAPEVEKLFQDDDKPVSRGRGGGRARALSQQPLDELLRERFGSGKPVVHVVGPGAGMHQNGKAYLQLGQDHGLQVEKAGASRAQYDRYPENWQGGAPAPNLKSFAEELLGQGWLDSTECLIVGSRGGQVVLPTLWQHRGGCMPPTVVINGGCAMHMPTTVFWPKDAMTFLLVGGQDNFAQGKKMGEYLDDIQKRVPQTNATTAVLYVEEMPHVPQAALLGEALPRMVHALLAWRATGIVPTTMFDELVQALGCQSFSGRFLYTMAAGRWSAPADFRPQSKRTW